MFLVLQFSLQFFFYKWRRSISLNYFNNQESEANYKRCTAMFMSNQQWQRQLIKFTKEMIWPILLQFHGEDWTFDRRFHFEVKVDFSDFWNQRRNGRSRWKYASSRSLWWSKASFKKFSLILFLFLLLSEKCLILPTFACITCIPFSILRTLLYLRNSESLPRAWEINIKG